MTDAEIICTFMEPPEKFTLDALWKVEERLTNEQWPEYRSLIQDMSPTDTRWSRVLLHATPEQKIKALAAVLRPIVEARGDKPTA